MIYIGKHMFSQVLCECGKPITNAMDGNKSAFVVGSCQNEDCENFSVGMTIERASMQVVAVDHVPSSLEGKRIYAVMADKDGKQLWPKVEIPVEKPTS